MINFPSGRTAYCKYPTFEPSSSPAIVSALRCQLLNWLFLLQAFPESPCF